MSKIAPLIVLVKSIHHQRTQATYSEAELVRAAEAILEGGGVLKPLVLKRRGFEEYDLVDGEFEYLAALKAQMLDPIKGETIDAYVMDDSNQEIVMQQLQIFRQREVTEPATAELPAGLSAAQLLSCLQPLFSQLENRLDQRFHMIEQQLQHLTTGAVSSSDTTPATVIEPVVKQAEPEVIPEPVATQVTESPAIPETNDTPAVALPTLPEWITWLNQVSAQQLAATVKQMKLGLSSKVQANLMQARPFQSAQAVKQVKGIGDKSFAALQQVVLQTTSSDIAATEAEIVKPVSAAKTDSVATSSAVIADPWLQTLNTEDAKDLLFKLSRAKLSSEAINLILNNRPFESLEVLQKLKGVGKAKVTLLKKLLG